MGDDTKNLQRAVQVMCVVPKAADDMMNVGRLQGFNVSTLCEIKQFSKMDKYIHVIIMLTKSAQGTLF